MTDNENMNAERVERGRVASIGRTIVIGFFTVAPSAESIQ